VDGSKGVSFFSTNHYVGPSTPNFFAGNGARSVTAWVYNPTAGDEETLFAWGARGADYRNSGFAHGVNGSFGALQMWGAGDLPWGTNAANIASNVKTSQWTFVAYTYDPATSNKSCYANGVLALSRTNANVLNTFFFDTSDPLNSGTPQIGRGLPFRVGAQSAGQDGTLDVSNTRMPNATLAKIKAYNQTLTAQQIADQYNAERVQFPGQPRITNVRVNPTTGFVAFDWVPAFGRTYAVERNDSVSNAAGWSTIATGQSSGSFTNDPGGIPRYYRLRIE
jgi:hypothetical protein